MDRSVYSLDTTSRPSLDHIALTPVAPTGGCCEKLRDTEIQNDDCDHDINSRIQSVYFWVISILESIAHSLMRPSSESRRA
jgi:hypothetical protein